MMVVGSVIKFILALGGILWTMALLIAAMAKKNNKTNKLQKAGLVFVATCVLLLVITVVEFIIIASM